MAAFALGPDPEMLSQENFHWNLVARQDTGPSEIDAENEVFDSQFDGPTELAHTEDSYDDENFQLSEMVTLDQASREMDVWQLLQLPHVELGAPNVG